MFFVDEVRRGEAELAGAEAEHLVRVLRAEEGQIYEISDNRKLYLARITTARKSMVRFAVVEELPVAEPKVELVLAAALFKFDHFEWLLEKAVEMGVSQIVPFAAVRTERGLEQAAAKRRARWERIAFETCQQSRRARLPEVAETVEFREALELSAEVRLWLDEESRTPVVRVLRSLEGEPAKVVLMTGPEGGWTTEERQMAAECGWRGCSLGDSILRAETAGIAGLAVVQAWAQAA